ALRGLPGTLSGSAQAVIFAALTAGLVVVFYIFYLRAPLADRENLRSEIVQLEAALAQRTTIETRLRRSESELARLEQRLEVPRGILPPQKETFAVLRSIPRMAAANHPQILKFNPQPAVPTTIT